MNLSKLQSIIKERNVDALFVSNPINIYYLAGFRGLSPEEREVSLLVTKESALLFVPRMYEAQAKGLNSVANGSVELVVAKERDDLMISWVERVSKEGTVLFEDGNLFVSEFQDIQKRFSGSLQPAGNIIEELRIIKQPDEINNIRKAVELTDQAFDRVLDLLRSGDYTKLTEFDVADFIRSEARKLGGEGLSFDSIVASGAGSALPHYFTGSNRLQKGDLLLIDWGVKYRGYCGDLTRCIALGDVGDEVRKSYQIVRDCNGLCIEACKAGMKEGELDDVAHAFFRERNLDQYFLHGLGHGIGLEAHEGVFLRSRRTRVLEPGMTITIEPGLYFESKFGIRVEDFVLVTESGCEVLSKASKELIVI